ncbi:MAG: sodium:solute symporter [Bacteroidia bacterium]|nr:sodium:solute symporter [Bacteroidia bacterium]
MSYIDWLVMCGTVLLIVVYGIYKSRHINNIQGYLLSGKDMKWWTIGLSIMATQASAITFLSTPGQAFDDGMRFVQFYFGVPIAMVIISIVVIPIFHRLNVYTAYEYLEQRFDLKTRSLAAFLFLISRGMAAGLTIYAPAIIFTALLGWQIDLTCITLGLVVLIYTVVGGNKAVSHTQKQQMFVILVGMILAGIVMILKLPPDVSLGDAVFIAGKMGKLNIITTPSSWAEFDIKDRYNLWSGLIGGTFLALSYFGTDQSQVQRYLGGKSLTESRIGLLFNGIFKVPMQFMILFIGAMMFVFYQFNSRPMFFNTPERTQIIASDVGPQYLETEKKYETLHLEKSNLLRQLLHARNEGDVSRVAQTQENLQRIEAQSDTIRQQGIDLIKTYNPRADTNDLDKIFLTFILHHLPVGLIGLLMAVILSASMSSTSAELNSLATTTIVDIYKRLFHKNDDQRDYLSASKWATFGWGIFAIGFALFASELGNLIQAVNILGSLFYGTLLGIFVVAFFMKKIRGTSVFYAAILAEVIVFGFYIFPQISPGFPDIGFLWFNLIGCVAVAIFSAIFQAISPKNHP